ncbi:MAG: hypothetical protein IKN54_04455, partial [Lachnospiraceae bacterium]|nr:hypothetical protein [Lachnospiraceae bacterium]
NEPGKTELTEKIAAAKDSIDFENAEIGQDAVVSKALLIKNLNLNGKQLTLEASGIELENVQNAVIVVDEKVGEGDVTITNCLSIAKLEIYGGGANSIHINKSNIASVEVKKDNVRLALEESSKIEAVLVEAANTKIESAESIEIKEIKVSDVVDKITIKGGTVEKVQIVPVEEDQSSAGQSVAASEKTQIVIDGKTEVKSVEGTKDVQLTKEAIQSGSNVVVKAPVPVVTYYDDTIVFLSNGDTTGTEFEGQDVYYEYFFDIVSKNEEDNKYGYKIKIYKLPDVLKVFMAAKFEGQIEIMEMTNEDIPGTIVDSNTLCIKDWYDASMILKSAGLVKGPFDENRVKLEFPGYDQEFDIKDCGIPEEIILPESPYKPEFTVTPSADGNVINITFNDSDDEQKPNKYISKSIFIYQGRKEDGKWLWRNLFSLNENTEKSVSFTDCFVDSGKEYAYLFDLNRYRPAEEDLVLVTAIGGNGEIVLSAENSTADNGIKLTISDVSYSADYYSDRTIFRYYENDDDERPCHVRIGNYKNDIVDYYTDKGTSYTYKAQYAFWNTDSGLRYTPIVKPCTIKATVGLGEPKITNSPAGSVNENKIFTFTEAPQIAVNQLADNAKYNITFNFVYTYQEGNSISTDTRTILYDPERSEEQIDINNIYNWSSHTYTYNKTYGVFITYSNGIHYDYVYTKGDLPGMADIVVQ